MNSFVFHKGSCMRQSIELLLVDITQGKGWTDFLYLDLKEKVLLVLFSGDFPLSVSHTLTNCLYFSLPVLICFCLHQYPLVISLYHQCPSPHSDTPSCQFLVACQYFFISFPEHQIFSLITFSDSIPHHHQSCNLFPYQLLQSVNIFQSTSPWLKVPFQADITFLSPQQVALVAWRLAGLFLHSSTVLHSGLCQAYWMGWNTWQHTVCQGCYTWQDPPDSTPEGRE